MVKFLWRMSFLTFVMLLIAPALPAQQPTKTELVRYPGNILSIREDAYFHGEMRIARQVRGEDQTVWHYWLYAYKFYLDGTEVRFTSIKTPCRAVFMYEKGGGLQEVWVITKPEDRAKAKKGCDCEFTGVCSCGPDCGCVSLVSAQDAKQRGPIQVTCKSGYVVTFVWKDSIKMYCPSEPGWKFDPDQGLWIPPVVHMPNQPLAGFSQFGGFQGQFGSFQGGGFQGGGCAGGSCGNPGGAGLFRRR